MINLVFGLLKIMLYDHCDYKLTTEVSVEQHRHKAHGIYVERGWYLAFYGNTAQDRGFDRLQSLMVLVCSHNEQLIVFL